MIPAHQKVNEIVLYGTQRSPFARRVRVALLVNQIVFKWRELTLDELFPPSDELLRVNPFGLVPAYVDPDGFALFDSSEILTHIDCHLIRLWPEIPPLRSRSRRISSLAQGILTYAVREFQDLRVRSTVSDFVEDNIEMIARSLSWINEEVPLSDLFFWRQEQKSFDNQIEASGFRPTQASFDVACALDYLDFRMSQKINWRNHCPAFEDVFAKISMVPAFSETRPK